MDEHLEDCNGNGGATCWDCGGDGFYCVPEDDDPMGDIEYRCDTCNGTGYLRCQACSRAGERERSVSRIVDFDRTQPHSFCGTGIFGTPWKPGEPGCGEPVFFDRPFPDVEHTAIRCAYCFAVFCVPCAKDHFTGERSTESPPEKGGPQ